MDILSKLLSEKPVQETTVIVGAVVKDQVNNDLSTIFCKLLQARTQLHWWHWQTYSVSEHKQLGKFYEALTDLLDNFAETAMGKLGRPMGGFPGQDLMSYQKGLPKQYICDMCQALCDIRPKFEQHTDLANQIDEMIALCNKTCYLLTFNEP